jgi:putative DNA primase/helicase
LLKLFHIHAGSKNSAGNGKTKFFDTLEMVLGDYVRKFPVQVLTEVKREEAGKPAPEYNFWRGRRILYCSEPNTDDTLNSGIMKDLTGGEKIIYRLLYSNDVLGFRPQFKMHIMCNDPPKVDGSDEGVKRRIRKIDYMARFVEADQVDESQFHYKIDSTFFDQLREDDGLKMEVLRYFLDHYHKDYEYQMPEFVANNSRMYLEENDGVRRFIAEYIVKDRDGCFTLNEAKELYKSKDYNAHRLNQLKADLHKHLGVECVAAKKIKGKYFRNVFMGYSISYGENSIDYLD